MYLLSSDILEQKIRKLGPDMLDDRITYQIFETRFNNYNKKIKIGLLLLDQTFVSGIGNYLRADILYLAKISPFRKLNDINKSELKRLYYYAYNLIRYYTSIQIDYNKFHLKTTLDYKLKYKSNDYGRVFLIYGEKFDIFNNPITKEKLNDRSIYWVKNIQT
jgi:formamidopyrimidine-DNA glycosylase